MTGIEPETASQAKSSQGPSPRTILAMAVVAAVLVLGLLVGGGVVLFRAAEPTTSRIRDIFIIFMALESFIVGLALIILIIQIATLINLLQNEIRPILNATNETVNTLRGTTVFLSNNLVEPVMKLNEYLAGIKRLLDMVRPGKR